MKGMVDGIIHVDMSGCLVEVALFSQSLGNTLKGSHIRKSEGGWKMKNHFNAIPRLIFCALAVGFFVFTMNLHQPLPPDQQVPTLEPLPVPENNLHIAYLWYNTDGKGNILSVEARPRN